MTIKNHLSLSYYKQFVQTYHNSFVDNLATFNSSFPELDSSFANDLQTLLNSLNSLQFDSEYVGTIAEHTMVKTKKEKEGRLQLQNLFRYAMIAFNDKAKLTDFGKNEYKKDAYNTLKLADLLNNAANSADLSENKPVLNAAGFTDTMIADLRSVSQELIDLQELIYISQVNRKDATRERSKLVEDIWTMLTKINQASKVIFFDNPALLIKFYLYK